MLEKDEDQLDQSCEKWISTAHSQVENKYSYIQQKEKRLIGLVATCIGTAF
jgi:hypothetical protein